MNEEYKCSVCGEQNHEHNVKLSIKTPYYSKIGDEIAQTGEHVLDPANIGVVVNGYNTSVNASVCLSCGKIDFFAYWTQGAD